MNLLHKILPRAGVLTVIFSDGDNYTVRLLKCRRRGGATGCSDAEDVTGLEGIRKELTSLPVIVAVGGYGVISKETSADIAGKVMADDSGFLWSEHGGTISFVRERQLAGLRQSLEDAGAKVVLTECIRHEKNAGDEQLKQTVIDIADRFYTEKLRVGNVLKPTAQGSSLAQLAASKLRLPVLGAVMLALTVNALYAPKVRGRYENARMEFEAVSKTIGQSGEASRRQQEFLAEYARTLPRRISLMCDRAAMALPGDITLTTLAVQPPARSPENNRKTVFANDCMVITGESTSSGSISQYVSALGGLDFARQVHLTSVEQEKESNMFIFKITVDL